MEGNWRYSDQDDFGRGDQMNPRFGMQPAMRSQFGQGDLFDDGPRSSGHSFSGSRFGSPSFDSPRFNDGPRFTGPRFGSDRRLGNINDNPQRNFKGASFDEAPSRFDMMPDEGPNSMMDRYDDLRDEFSNSNGPPPMMGSGTMFSDGPGRFRGPSDRFSDEFQGVSNKRLGDQPSLLGDQFESFGGELEDQRNLPPGPMEGSMIRNRAPGGFQNMSTTQRFPREPNPGQFRGPGMGSQQRFEGQTRFERPSGFQGRPRFQGQPRFQGRPRFDNSPRVPFRPQMRNRAPFSSGPQPSMLQEGTANQQLEDLNTQQELEYGYNDEPLEFRPTNQDNDEKPVELESGNRAEESVDDMEIDNSQAGSDSNFHIEHVEQVERSEEIEENNTTNDQETSQSGNKSINNV